MDCWIYRDGAIESTPITDWDLRILIRSGRLTRSSEIRSAAGGGWETIESSDFRQFLPGERSSDCSTTDSKTDPTPSVKRDLALFKGGCLILFCALFFGSGFLMLAAFANLGHVLYGIFWLLGAR